MTLFSDEARVVWRARREERRAKQRAGNIVRAQKMHDARLEYEQRHPLSVPDAPVPPGDRQVPPQVFVGCSGWYYWHWRDSFYPPGEPSSRWFSHYASQFKTVELNAPFYSWPTLATVNTWIVSFHYTPAALTRILKQLDPRRRNVVEFRHRSWWNEAVFKAFRDTHTIFCSTSGPGLPDELIRTADDVYIRFHAIKKWYRHDYTEEELSVWTTRIEQSGARHVWGYFNNDREGYAVKKARDLIRQLNRKWPGS